MEVYSDFTEWLYIRCTCEYTVIARGTRWKIQMVQRYPSWEPLIYGYIVLSLTESKRLERLLRNYYVVLFVFVSNMQTNKLFHCVSGA